MKKLLYPAIALMALSSCTGNKNETPTATPTENAVETATANTPAKEGTSVQLSAQDEQKIKDYIKSFYSQDGPSLYEDGWMKAHCTPALIKALKEDCPYDGDCYALWQFEGQGDGEESIKRLHSLDKQNDGSFLATVYLCYENNSQLNGIRYVRYAASVINNEVVFSECNYNPQGTLGESEKIWKNNIPQLEKMAKEFNEFGKLEKITFIDVDEDGIFELFASDGSTNCCFTLADAEGKVDGFKNAKMIAIDPTKHVKIKVKPDAHMVFYSGGIGMGATSEDYSIIKNSHVAELYQYTKELNPLDENEFSEEATVSFGESTRTSSNDEINKNCRTKGQYVLTLDLNWKYLVD